MKNTAPYDNAPPATLAYKTGDNQSELVADDKPLPTKLAGVNLSGPAVLAFKKVTATTTAATLGSLLGGTVLADAIAAGATAALVSVETNPVRVRADDVDPDATTGHQFAKDLPPYPWDFADLAKVRVIGVGGSATLQITLVK